MDKFLCFRFDVDTHVCIKDGAPNLIELFKRHDARCTFFVNMGSAFNWKIFLEKKIKNLFSKKINVGCYSVVKKLGFINTFQAIFINQKVGASNGKILTQIVNNGNEICFCKPLSNSVFFLSMISNCPVRLFFSVSNSFSLR